MEFWGDYHRGFNGSPMEVYSWDTTSLANEDPRMLLVTVGGIHMPGGRIYFGGWSKVSRGFQVNPSFDCQLWGDLPVLVAVFLLFLPVLFVPSLSRFSNYSLWVVSPLLLVMSMLVERPMFAQHQCCSPPSQCQVERFTEKLLGFPVFFSGTICK